MSTENQRIYRVFTRTAKNWEQFARASKRTVERNLTYSEAHGCCERYNLERTSAQIFRGTKYEFTTQ